MSEHTNGQHAGMIEQVRRAHLEKTFDADKHLSARGQMVYRTSADHIHKQCVLIRRSLQGLFDFIQFTKTDSPEHTSWEKHSSDHVLNQQYSDLTLIFCGISKAAKDIVKGGLMLKEQGADVSIPEGFLESIIEESRKLLDLCNILDIPAADDEFLRKVLSTLGFEGFQGLLMDDEFEILRKKPILFKQAVMHQQGDPVAFLRSETLRVQKGVDELKASGEFDDLLEKKPDIFIEALLDYRDQKIQRGGRSTYKFSNAHDYLLHLRKELEQKDKKSRKKKKNGSRRDMW